MSAWRSIQTAGELLDYPDGGRLAFFPSGELRSDQGIEEEVIFRSARRESVIGLADQVVLAVDTGDLTFTRHFMFPHPTFIEVEPAETMTTYRCADGELVGGDYEWVVDLEWFKEDEWGLEGVKVVKEVWTLTATEEIHLHPEECWSCEKPWHAETCNEEPEEN